MSAEPKIKSWTTAVNGEKIVHVQIERLEPSAFFAGGCGNSFAEALMRAAVTLYNRECAEFNTVEFAREAEDKKNYSIPAERRYKARRRPPVIVITTHESLDLTMFHNQMKITCENAMRCIKDITPLVETIRMREDAVPFRV